MQPELSLHVGSNIVNVNQQLIALRAVLDALRSATKLGTYPIMCILLRIMATLPVTTALKYIETYLRSTMRGEERLNGPTQM
jgi:hypothetical protein